MHYLSTRQMFISLILLICSTLTACGGQGGSKAKSVSSFEQLQGLSTKLQNQFDQTMAPITLTDEIISDFENLPKALNLSPKQFKAVINTVLQGEVKLPEGINDEPANKLNDFARKLSQFKTAILATPDQATALVTRIGEGIIKVSVLVTEIETKAKSPVVPMVFSKKDKAKAEKEASEAKKLSEDVIAQLNDMKTKAMGLPNQAANSITKFSNSLKSLGIDHTDALMKAGKNLAQEQGEKVLNQHKDLVDTAKDVKASVKDIKASVKDIKASVKDVSKLAKDPKGAAKDTVKDVVDSAKESAKDVAEGATK